MKTLCLLKFALAATLLSACAEPEARLDLTIATSKQTVDIGDSVDVTFTNVTETDLYVVVGCRGVERRSGNTWLTPQSLTIGCNSDPSLTVRLASGERLIRRTAVWGAPISSSDILGRFRLFYNYRRLQSFDADKFRAYSNEFTVR